MVWLMKVTLIKNYVEIQLSAWRGGELEVNKWKEALEIGVCGRVWEGVGGCGRVWEGVGVCGRV